MENSSRNSSNMNQQNNSQNSSRNNSQNSSQNNSQNSSKNSSRNSSQNNSQNSSQNSSRNKMCIRDRLFVGRKNFTVFIQAESLVEKPCASLHIGPAVRIIRLIPCTGEPATIL